MQKTFINLDGIKVGRITKIQDNIITVTGLRNCFLGEMIVFHFPNNFNCYATVAVIEDHKAIKLVLVKGSQTELSEGTAAYRAYRVVQTIVGFGVLGKVVTSLGDLVDDDENADTKTVLMNDYLNVEYSNIFTKSPSIIQRETVAIPFFTGVSTVDCFTPIGCGQRQLIIGDFNTGKTSLALTMLLNQRYIMNVVDKVWRGLEQKLAVSFAERALKFMPCIFVAVGKRRSEVLRIKKVLQSFDALHYTTIVFTSSEDVPTLQYYAPYAGCTIGEWFRERSYHALVIFDDLSQHAVAYRQISLLLRIPPGREAYPGDIFYVQARLLERGAQLSKACGAGSLTILPIIETKGGDISAYIPTNVISITDGQVFLSSSIINKGLRPGVNIGLSVSRVGSKAQYNSVKFVSKKVKRDYILYKTYEGLSKISSDMDPLLMAFVNRGTVIMKFLSQKLFQTVRLLHQVIAFYCISEGFFDNIDTTYIPLFFELYFKGYFMEGYLENNEELSKYLIVRNFVFAEAVFISSSLEPSLLDISQLSKLFSSFFKDQLLIKITTDKLYYNILLAAVRNNLVVKNL